MILKNYYEQKKQSIIRAVRDLNNSINVELFSDSIFTNSNYNFPIVLFKYKNIEWNTSSEQEYKADVEFCVCIVLEPSMADYIGVFDIANKVDEAILLRPTKADINENNIAIASDDTIIPLITNSVFKTSERQYTVEDDFWEKNNYFIWEINYKTTLVEKSYKKRYTMISNGFFNNDDLNNNIEGVRSNLRRIGLDLDDYHLVERNGKQQLIIKEVEERLTFNGGSEGQGKKELIIKNNEE